MHGFNKHDKNWSKPMDFIRRLKVEIFILQATALKPGEFFY